MVMKSRSQNRMFQAAARDPEVAERLGVKRSVAKKLVKESRGQKVGKLPERVQKLAKGGSVKGPRSSDEFREQGQERMKSIIDRGERGYDTDTYFKTFGEDPPAAEERPKPQKRPPVLKTQPDRSMRRQSDPMPKRFSEGGPVAPSKPSCKW